MDRSSVHLCVPWRTDHGQRERIWRACFARWSQMFPDGRTFLGTSPEQPFNRAAARNAAVEALTEHRPDWDVVVLGDADVMVGNAQQVYDAVELAREKVHLTFAHTFRAGLSRRQTERVLSGAPVVDLVRRPEEYESWEGNTLSGVYAVPRRLWDAVGGFDERFRGWGGEDVAFAQACAVLSGGRRSRVPGVSYHLWHETRREEREDQPHYAANWRLYERYMAASTPPAMREVLAR